MSRPIASLTAWARACSVPRYRSVVSIEAWPSNSWICSSSPPAFRQSFAQVQLADLDQRMEAVALASQQKEQSQAREIAQEKQGPEKDIEIGRGRGHGIGH